MSSRFLTVLPALAAMLLTSCLDYEEDMVIHKDLSGEMAVVVTLPDKLISKYDSLVTEFSAANVEKRFADFSGVTLVGYELVDDRKPVAKLKLRFKSLESLNEAIEKISPAGILLGKFTVKKEGGKTVISRQLGEGTPKLDMAEFNYAQYKIHFDGTIDSTNSGFYNSMGSDVRYRYKITDLLAQKPLQTTTVVRALPWGMIFGCIAILAGAAFWGWKLLGKKKVAVK